MNPFCPNCNPKVMLIAKFRTWTDQMLGRQYGARVWECPHCKRRWKRGKGAIMKK